MIIPISCVSSFKLCLPQYKDDLSSDEEIFAEKAKEVEALKEHVRELEEEKSVLNSQLQETLLRLKKHEDQLFQQQLQLNQLVLHQDSPRLSGNRRKLSSTSYCFMVYQGQGRGGGWWYLDWHAEKTAFQGGDP